MEKEPILVQEMVQEWDSPERDPEFQLQELVLADLGAEPNRPVGPATVVMPGDATESPGSRGKFGLLLAAAVAVIGVGLVVLQISGHPSGRPDAPPPAETEKMATVRSVPSSQLGVPSAHPDVEPRPSAAATGAETSNSEPGKSVSTRVVPVAPASSNPASAATALGDQRAEDNAPSPATTVVPKAGGTTRPKSDATHPTQHGAGVAADLPAATAATAVSEPGMTKPVLWIYYSFESPLASKDAQSLTARTAADVAHFEFKAQNDLPPIAVVRYLEARNHALAQAIGKSLANLGYRWRIENASNSVGSQRSMIEVWLPTK